MRSFNEINSGFSVLLSVYYKEESKYLNESLISIWDDQILKPSQIVLVQDGPLTQELANVLEAWSAKLGSVLCLIPLVKNVGLAAALNEGLKYCKYEIVALSTDEFNWDSKQKKCYFDYEKRKQLLEAIRYVDLVIPEISWEQKKTDIIDYKVSTFVIGDDWKGKFDYLKNVCDVVYLERTPEISTTQIKKELQIK